MATHTMRFFAPLCLTLIITPVSLWAEGTFDQFIPRGSGSLSGGGNRAGGGTYVPSAEEIAYRDKANKELEAIQKSGRNNTANAGYAKRGGDGGNSSKSDSAAAERAKNLAAAEDERERKKQAAFDRAPLYVLKNGAEIRALQIVDGGENVTVKDESDKFHTISKADIAEIIERQKDQVVDKVAERQTEAKKDGNTKPNQPATRSANAETSRNSLSKDTGVTSGKDIIYVLKNGTRIAAVQCIDGGEELTIKDDSGKFRAIKKADIDETIKPAVETGTQKQGNK